MAAVILYHTQLTPLRMYALNLSIHNHVLMNAAGTACTVRKSLLGVKVKTVLFKCQKTSGLLISVILRRDVVLFVLAVM